MTTVVMPIGNNQSSLGTIFPDLSLRNPLSNFYVVCSTVFVAPLYSMQKKRLVYTKSLLQLTWQS